MSEPYPKKQPGHRATRWYVRYPRAAPIGMFIVILAITLLAVYAIERTEDERIAAQTSQSVKTLGSRLESQSLTAVAYLRAGAAYVVSEDELDAPGFAAFFTEMREDARYRGVVGIGWAPRVRTSEIEQFEEGIRADGREDFMLDRPSGAPSAPSTDVPLADAPSTDVPSSAPPAVPSGLAREFILPVRFVNPSTLGNRALVGYDLSSDPVVAAALETAERTGRSTASGPINLGNTPEGDERTGFMLVMPVFEEEFGFRSLRGFVFSPFEARGFLEDAIEAEALEDLSVELYDAVGDDRIRLARAGTTFEGESVQAASETINISGREWDLTIAMPSERRLSNLSLATLLFGLLASVLIVAITRLLTAQATEDREALVWLQEQNAIRDTLTRELNHRVKNTLANVLSIISLTRRRAENIEDFAESLGGRIRALSATHDLLTQSDWGTTPIGSVIEAEIAPYREGHSHQVRLEGPEVELAPNDALSFGLAIHELATNASKYGSLSVTEGELDVTWEMIAKDLVRVKWYESGGPAVAPEGKRGLGFGTELISKIVAHELRNPVDLQFEPGGVRCTLVVPVRTPAEFGLRAPRPSKDVSPAGD